MDAIKILIIEDDEYTLNELNEIIKGESFETLLSRDGKKGLEIFLKEKPDIILTDIKLPDINGLDLVKEIKNASKDTPIIITDVFCLLMQLHGFKNVTVALYTVS